MKINKKLKLVLLLIATPVVAFIGSFTIGRIYISETIDDYKNDKL